MLSNDKKAAEITLWSLLETAIQYEADAIELEYAPEGLEAAFMRQNTRCPIHPFRDARWRLVADPRRARTQKMSGALLGYGEKVARYNTLFEKCYTVLNGGGQ